VSCALQISDNSLTALPDAVCLMTSLEQLDIAGNDIVALPPRFFDLKRLRHLYAQYNNLTRLPEDMYLLPSLEVRRAVRRFNGCACVMIGVCVCLRWCRPFSCSATALQSPRSW
jgi:hypothetical protein